MLVDVIRLRRDGVKLPQEVYLMEPAVRGRLWVSNFRPAEDGQTTPLMAAILGTHLPVLDHAVIRSIKDGNLMVCGLEDLSHNRKFQRLRRQSWWCRVVEPDWPAVKVAEPVLAVLTCSEPKGWE